MIGVAALWSGIGGGLGVGAGGGRVMAATQQEPSAAPATQPATSEPRQRATLRVRVEGAGSEEMTGRWDPTTGVLAFKPPHGRVIVDWDGWQAYAASLEVDPDSQIATMTGPVALTQSELDASADRLEAHYGEGRAILTGHVRIEQWSVDEDGKRVAHLRTIRAEKAEVDDTARRFVATGKVEVMQDDPVFRAAGDTLAFDQEAGQAILTAAGDGVRAILDRYELTRAPKVVYDVETGALDFFGPADLRELPAEPGA